MKFKYTGDLEEVSFWGYTFPRGEAVDIDETKIAYSVKRKRTGDRFNVLVVDKMKGNKEFELVEVEIKTLPEITPKKRGRKPKVDNGNTSGSQESSIKQA